MLSSTIKNMLNFIGYIYFFQLTIECFKNIFAEKISSTEMVKNTFQSSND